MSYSPQRGDLVWARMKGYPPWPARILNWSDYMKTYKKGNQWVYFFGTNNFGWIEEKFIKPYQEFQSQFSNLGKTNSFKQAVSDIENHLEKKTNEAGFDAVFEEDVKKLYNSGKQPREKSTPAKRKTLDNSNTGSATKKTKSNNSISKQSKQQQQQTPIKSPVVADTANDDSNGPPSPTITPKTETAHTNESFNTTLDHIPYTDEIEAYPPTAVDISKQRKAIDVSRKTIKNKKIVASDLSFGFMGLGVMGSSIVRNLIISGHKVNLWNRTPEKCDEIKDQAELNNQSNLVQIYLTPTDVVQNSDVIFSCLADPASAKEIVTGNCGVIHDAKDSTSLQGKGYVEMTSIDPTTSHDIENIITSRGGRYLEAQLQGSKTQADECSLIILAAGDESLFNDCKSCFKAMGKTAIYLGSTGYATKMNLYLNMALGISLVGLAEGLSLAERCGLSLKHFLEIFNSSKLQSNYLATKGNQMVEKRFRDTEQAVKYMQKDIKLCLDISDDLKQNLPVAAAANEVYKTVTRFNSDYDVCSILNRL